MSALARIQLLQQGHVNITLSPDRCPANGPGPRLGRNDFDDNAWSLFQIMLECDRIAFAEKTANLLLLRQPNIRQFQRTRTDARMALAADWLDIFFGIRSAETHILTVVWFQRSLSATSDASKIERRAQIQPFVSRKVFGFAVFSLRSRPVRRCLPNRPIYDFFGIAFAVGLTQ